jgi:glycyl-tRNA synthetase beta chain
MAGMNADLLIEIIQEEIPARMQHKAAQDLARLFAQKFAEANLQHGEMHSFVAPRHLALYVDGLAAQQQDSIVEKRGPRVDAPEAAIAGFLKSTGLAFEDLIAEETPKGTFLFARTEMKGAATKDMLPAMIADILVNFPWPKSQRWGVTRFRWVRPLHRVNVLFDGVGLDGSLDMGGADLAFGTNSSGHYFEAPDDLDLVGLKSADAYQAMLAAAYVDVDAAARLTTVTTKAAAHADALGCVVKTSAARLAEVAGLIEHANLLVGAIEARFMALPAEVLQSSIETHQKYITLATKDGAFSPHFIVVSNRRNDAKRDAVILAGNQRVLRARLADAEFFWLEDAKSPLGDALPRLADIAFYEGLGNVHEKALRLQKLAVDIANAIATTNAAVNPVDAGRAGLLAKADLVSGMVGEFPELQGIMGGYYAAQSGESETVAAAISAHYRPQGPDDQLPDTPEGLAVALADKIDTLVGFFGVGAKPTGSKDPFALRRAALGIIRIITEAKIRLPLSQILQASATYHGFGKVDGDLLPFIRERLRVSLRDGMAHDVVEAALGNDAPEDILLLADRTAALGAFLGTENGAALIAGWRRAGSILAAEEGKDKTVFTPKTEPDMFSGEAEADLYAAIINLPDGDLASVQSPHELVVVMQTLGSLRKPIDRFFDELVVNDDNPNIRLNRLGLLAMVRAKMLGVADFSKLEG